LCNKKNSVGFERYMERQFDGYNARHRYKNILEVRDHKCNMLKCLEGNDCVFKYRTVNGSKTVENIFLAHLESLKL